MISEIRTPLRVFFNVSRSLDVFLALFQKRVLIFLFFFGLTCLSLGV